MQYGHWVTCATATAINGLVTFGNAPSANTAALNALNAFSGSGASSRRLCAISAEDGGYIDVSMTDSLMVSGQAAEFRRRQKVEAGRSSRTHRPRALHPARRIAGREAPRTPLVKEQIGRAAGRE